MNESNGKERKRRHTIVLSDVHLSQAHPDDPADPLWMLYRTRRFHPDADFAGLVDRLLSTLEGDDLSLVFNGDLLDFDAPWVKDGTSSFDEFPLDDDGCAAQARRIAEDHPLWFEAVARVALAGHEVLFASGNHDLELYFPGARAAILDAILARAEALAARERRPAPSRASVTSRVTFRTWFHLTEDSIYLEHGSQYDIYNGVSWPMIPLTRSRDRIHPVLGKQAFKRTGSRMGFFNPYYEETFYMGLFGYLGHFWRHYARSHRHIWRTWFFGAIATAREIWEHRHDDDWSGENAELARVETGAPLDAIWRTQALRAKMADSTFTPVLRELWLDRVAFVALLLAVLPAFLFGWRAGLVAIGSWLVIFVAYELLTPKPDIRTYDSAPPEVREIWDIHGARAICMGHTHRPFGHWEGGRFYGNSGSWCPAFKDAECTEPVLRRRPFLWLVRDGDRLTGGLHWWKDGVLEADPEATT